MLFEKKIERTLDYLRGKHPAGSQPLTEADLESDRPIFEKGDLPALILAAFRVTWPIFLVLILLAIILLCL